MRTYQMEEGYFFIKNKEEFSKLPASLVGMEQPIDEKSFIAKSGTSDYTWIYAGNTYRTVTADKKLELPLEEDMSTISWDIYKNNGQFFAQMILFVSFDRDKGQVFNFSRKIENICLALEKKLTKFNELVKEFNMTENLSKNLPVIQEMLIENLNATVIITFHDPKMITNSLQKLPEDCSIYVKTKFVEDYEHAFEFETTRCYVLTNENGHKLFFLEKNTENDEVEIEKQEIECKNLGALRKSLGESVFKTGILEDFSKIPTSNGTCPTNLRILTDFLSREKMASSKASPSYTTLIMNKGKHTITAVNPLISTSSPVYFMFHEQTISFSIDHGKAGEVLLVQSHPGLLNEKNLLDQVDHKYEHKSTKETTCFDFTNIPSKLALEAEILRQQAAKTWQPLHSQAWLLLVSRLWVFQTVIEDKDFILSDPADPIYGCLMLATLTEFGYLQKALNITQKFPDDQVKIENKHVTEIKKQWGEASETKKRSKSPTMTSWKKAFRFHNPKVQVEHGKAVRLLCVDPIGHATKLPRFQAMPILPHNKKILESRSIRNSIDENYRTMVSTCFPATSNAPLTADTIREYIYTDDQSSFNQDAITAKLTVLYSPVFIETDNWIEKFTGEREKILLTLSGNIFNGIEHFLKYSNESLPTIRKWITEILTNRSFSGVNASLLFCLNIQQGQYQCRFLVGVGNNMALAFEQGKTQPITKIGAMYEVGNEAVSLNSLKKPDKLRTGGIDSLTTFLNPSRTRHEECIQIAIVDDPSVEILLIPGRILAPESFMLMPEKNSKLGFRTYAPDIKLLNVIEETDSSPIQNIVKALQAHRKKLLGFITDPDMISAWSKLDRSLVAKESPDNISTTSGFEDEDKYENLETSKNSSDLIDYDYVASIGRLTALLETLKFNADSLTEFDEIKERTSSTSDTLTDSESKIVNKLWQAAINEEKDLPADGNNDYADIGRFSEMNWNKTRKRYFLYFQGVTDSIALFVPTQTIEQPKLIEHVYGLGQYYFHALTSEGRGSEAQEILTFAHLLCFLPEEKTILKTINDKLKTFDQEYLENQAPQFWIQLIKLLVFLYLPENDLTESSFSNLQLLKSKLTELSGLSLQTTSRSSGFQGFLTSLSNVLDDNTSFAYVPYLP